MQRGALPAFGSDTLLYMTVHRKGYCIAVLHYVKDIHVIHSS